MIVRKWRADRQTRRLSDNSIPHKINRGLLFEHKELFFSLSLFQSNLDWNPNPNKTILTKGGPQKMDTHKKLLVALWLKSVVFCCLLLLGMENSYHSETHSDIYIYIIITSSFQDINLPDGIFEKLFFSNLEKNTHLNRLFNAKESVHFYENFWAGT